jgi:D-serine deaminase-like pyridoxal phosphate-dependent protein
MHTGDLETPAVVVDLDRLEANVARMASYAREHGLALRPHAKTHKSQYVGNLQRAAGLAGFTCATPRELEALAAVDSSLLLAYPPIGSKCDRLMALDSDVALSVMLDSAESLDCVGESAERAGRRVGVLVELDVGMRRVGVQSVDQAIQLIRRIERYSHLEYGGIGFYPGHIRQNVSEQEPALSALRDLLATVLERLGKEGLQPRVVSGGSTPTAFASHTIPGLTEMRPGTYVYNDRTTAEIGACGWEDCALTVLATVVSTSVSGQAVIDAGTKSLGREPLRAGTGGDDLGSGALLDHPDVTVARTSEEHGVLDLSRTRWRPRVGDRVRVVPNHVCIVTHLSDLAHGMRGEEVQATWPVTARAREPVEHPRAAGIT